MKLTGGFPYLIRLALYHARLKIPLQTLLQDATRDAGIYQQHLQYQLWNLQQHPKLADAFQKVLTAPIQLEIEVAFKLKSLGLIHLIENQATVSCELYREYFHNYFS
jgi:hypothetical protein